MGTVLIVILAVALLAALTTRVVLDVRRPRARHRAEPAYLQWLSRETPLGAVLVRREGRREPTLKA